MRRQLLTGLTMFAMMTVLVGVIYPLAVTGVCFTGVVLRRCIEIDVVIEEFMTIPL